MCPPLFEFNSLLLEFMSQLCPACKLTSGHPPSARFSRCGFCFYDRKLHAQSDSHSLLEGFFKHDMNDDSEEKKSGLYWHNQLFIRLVYVLLVQNYPMVTILFSDVEAMMKIHLKCAMFLLEMLYLQFVYFREMLSNNRRKLASMVWKPQQIPKRKNNRCLNQ